MNTNWDIKKPAYIKIKCLMFKNEQISIDVNLSKWYKSLRFSAVKNAKKWTMLSDSWLKEKKTSTIIPPIPAKGYLEKDSVDIVVLLINVTSQLMAETSCKNFSCFDFSKQLQMKIFNRK